MSYVLYVGVLVGCWLFARFADQYNNKKCVWLIVILLTLISGLRAYSVGIDTAHYVDKFSYIRSGELQYAYGLEQSFKYICYVFLNIIPNYSALLTFFAFIINGFIIWRLWDFRSVASFATMVSCYFMSNFFISLNGIRQFCAIAILTYATRYLVKHQNFRYILGVLAASLFHQSSMIGLVFFAFSLMRWRALSVRQKLFFISMIAALPVVIFSALRTIERYDKYFADATVDIGVMVPVKILFFFASLLFVFVLYGRKKHFANWDEMDATDKNQILLGCVCYFFGLCLVLSSYFLPIMNRVSWYFTIFECIYMGMLMRTKHPLHRYVLGLCIVAIIGHGFMTAMTDNVQGTMPYLFIWQQ